MPTPNVPTRINVAAIRKKLGLSQLAFAQRFALNVKSVRAWERKRRPDAAARALLTAISRGPELVDRLLAAPTAPPPETR